MTIDGFILYIFVLELIIRLIDTGSNFSKIHGIILIS